MRVQNIDNDLPPPPIIDVSRIEVSSTSGSSSVEINFTLQMSAMVSPANARNRTVTWSVVPSDGDATIGPTNGLLSATQVGTVTVVATANDRSGVRGELVVTVTPRVIPSPARPSRLVANSQPGSTTIELEWEAPMSDGVASDVTGYQIRFSADAGRTWNNLVDDSGNLNRGYSHQSLPLGGIFFYQVFGINEGVVGLPSAIALGIAGTVVLSAPGRPRDLAAVPSSDKSSIILFWKPPYLDGGGDITGYRIEFSLDRGQTWNELESGTGNADVFYRHSNLEKGDEYRYRVFAINPFGRSTSSNVASAEVFDDPQPIDPPIRFDTPLEASDRRSDDIQLYPNPVDDELNIVAPPGMDCMIEVYSPSGVRVFDEFIEGGAMYTIDVQHLSRGVYLLTTLREGVPRGWHRFIKL